MMKIGIDLGGTFIKAGITDDNNNIIISGKAPTGLPCPAEQVVENCAKLVRRLVADAGLKISDIAWIGAGVPGAVNCAEGIIEFANNLRFKDVPFAKLLREHIDLPVYVGNDANIAAYGEYIKSEEKYTSFVFITLGTGLGGGIIIDGKIYTGFNYAGAELGHIVIAKDGIECSCGRKGCWECYSSTNALIRMTKERMVNAPASKLWTLAEGDIENVDGKVIFTAVAQKDETAQAALDEFIDYLACGVGSVINIFQPEVLCIGGGISAQHEYLIEPLRKLVDKETYAISGKKTEIRAAKLQNDAGIIGAAALGELYK